MDVEKSFGSQLRATTAPLVRLHVFLNERSGAGRAGSLRDRLQEAADRENWSVVFHEIGGEKSVEAEVRRIIDHQNRREENRIIVAGGDGSIRSVARILAGSGVRLGVIPTGTFNYFARTHGIPTDEQGAIQVIMDGHSAAVQCGLANEELFLVNLSLGSYAQSIAAREKTTRKLGRRRIVAFFATLWTLVSSRKRMQVEIACEQGRTQNLATPFVFVGNNRLQLETFDPELAEDVGKGLMTLITARTNNPWQKLGLMVKACFFRLEQLQRVSVRRAENFVITSRKRSAPVALDGEMTELQYPIRIRAWEEAIELLVPGRTEI